MKLRSGLIFGENHQLPSYYDRQDLLLAATNMTNFGMMVVKIICDETDNNSMILDGALICIGIFRKYQSFRHANPSVRMGYSLVNMIAYIGSSKPFNVLGALKKLPGVYSFSSNALSKSAYCILNFRKHPFSAIFGLAIQGYNVFNEIVFGIDGIANLYKLTYRSPPSENTIERLTYPFFNPKNVKHAEIMISGIENRSSSLNYSPFGLYIGEPIHKTSLTCSDVSVLARSILKQVHPDKHPNEPLAHLATTNLLAARKTLEEYMKC